MKKFAYIILLLLVMVFGFTFTYKNPQTVEVLYYGGLQWEGPLSLLLLGAVIVGALIGALCLLISNLKVRRRLSRAKRETRHSQQELSAVRSNPG